MPKRTPRKRPIVEPVINSVSAPENRPDRIVYEAYPLIDYEQHGKCHPHYYGDCVGEFLTRPLAKQHLRDHRHYGAFALVEKVNGKISQTWTYTLDPPDDDAGVDYNSAADPRIEVARLQAKLEATRNGAHNPVLEKMAERFLDEKMRDPLDQLTGTAEKYERLRTMFGARQSNPAQTDQQQTDNSSDLKMLETFTPLLNNPDASIRETATDVIGRLVTKFSKDEPSWVELGMQALQNPNTVQIVQTVGNIFLNALDRVIPARPAPVSAQPAPMAQQQQPQVAQATAQPLPEVQQQARTAPAIENAQQPQAMPLPEEQALALLLDHCARNQPVQIAFDRLMAFADAVNEQVPAYSIDGYIEMLALTPTDTVIEYLKTLPNGAQVANMAHTPSWCSLLQNAIKNSGFLDQDADEDVAPFDRVTEINGGNVKL